MSLAVAVQSSQRQAGSRAEAEFAVFGGRIACPTCAVNIERALHKVPGVEGVDVNLASERIKVGPSPDQAESQGLRGSNDRRTSHVTACRCRAEVAGEVRSRRRQREGE